MGRSKAKFYGVRIGRDGPRVYKTWAECSNAVTGYSSALYKGFPTRSEADDWIEPFVTNVDSDSPGPSFDNTPMPGSYAAESDPSEGEAAYVSCLTSPIAGSSRLPDNDPIVIEDDSDDDNPIVIDDDSDDDVILIEDSGVGFKNTYASQDNRKEDAADENSEADFIPLDESKPCAAPTEPPPPVVLSNAQEKVLEKVKRGESVFFTGSAGTGKSVLLREIIKELRGRSNGGLAITASTGIAAVNIGGVTLHSFAGIGLGKETAAKLIGKFRKTMKHIWTRWRQTRTLIIDEVSMLDGALFDKLEYIARELRDSDQPFGGIQLVLSGDFCQLPPVPDRHDGNQIPIKFAFEANTWEECVGDPIVLTKVFRQRDQKFIDMLNDMRFGNMDDESAREFAALSREVHYEDGIEPTELFPMRFEVEKSNGVRLDKLPGPAHTFVSMDTPGYDVRGNRVSEAQAEQLLERLVAVKEITLKVGAQVMLIKNLVQGMLVNGSLGQVIDFVTAQDAQQKGLSISKEDSSPGTDRVYKDKVEEKLLSAAKQSGRKWPVVKFTSGQTLCCIPAEFSVQNLGGGEEAKRDQVPLILAWALSIHKSQGQTLERVKVNLARIFEKGQAYVALSRATKLETLQVLNFDRSKVMAHPRVLAWHEELEHRLHEAEEQDIHDFMDSEEAMEAFYADYDDDA